MEVTKPRAAGSEKKHLGIPEAIFMDNVDEYMQQNGGRDGVGSVKSKFADLYQQYKLMEYNLVAKRDRLKQQQPELQSSLDALHRLKAKNDAKESVNMHFMLSDTLYAKARIPPTGKVGIWLGANVMIEYTIGEAETLLTANSSQAVTNLAMIEQDLAFLRDQMTTVEVNVARLHNWSVSHAPRSADNP